MADATFSMNSVPGERWRELMLYWAFRLMFSRRLRWTINFANGALGAVGSERRERRREVNRSTAVLVFVVVDVLVHCKGLTWH